MGSYKIGVQAEGFFFCGDRLGILPCVHISPAQIEWVVGWIMGVEAHRLVDRLQGLRMSPYCIEPLGQHEIHLCIVGSKAHSLLELSDALFILSVFPQIDVTLG